MQSKPNIYFQEYEFTEQELEIIHKMLNTEILRAYIQTLLAKSVKRIMLDPLPRTSTDIPLSLALDQAFMKGLIELGTDLITMEQGEASLST